MPLYEYKCEKCGDVFEKLQKFSDEPVAIHEKCGGAVHRLISTSALLFKGSGFYVNDYAKSGSPGSANGGKKEGDGSAGGKDKESAGSSKESTAGASSDSTKSDAAKSDSSKSTGSSEGSKDTSKPAPATAPATSSTSSDKK
jgi:putative FmdB family regulatory protein